MLSFKSTTEPQSVHSNVMCNINNNSVITQEINHPLFSQIDSAENSSEYFIPATESSIAPSSEHEHKSTSSRLGWITALVTGITVLTGAGLLMAANIRNDVNTEQPIDTVLVAKIPVFLPSKNSSASHINDQEHGEKKHQKNSTKEQNNITEPYSNYRTHHIIKQKKTPSIAYQYLPESKISDQKNSSDVKISRDDFYSQMKKDERYPAGEKVNAKLKSFYHNKIYNILSSEVKSIDNNQKLISIEYLTDLLGKYKEKENNIKNSHGYETELTAHQHQEEILARKKIETIIFAAEIIISNNKLLNNVFFESIEGAINRINLSDEDIIRKEKSILDYVKKSFEWHVGEVSKDNHPNMAINIKTTQGHSANGT